MDILVSIIVPVYNMGNKIKNCVQSLVRQSYNNIEIILVDDGSKDDSLLICNELAAADSRIKVYHTENRGSGPARNFGIKNSSGNYLYFPDADDYVSENAIATLVLSAVKYDADIVLCGFRNINEAGKIVFEKKYNFSIVSGDKIRNKYAYYKVLNPQYGVCGAPWNKLFKKSVISKYSVEYPSLRRHQDESFVARFFSYCNRAVFIEDVLYTYYTNSQDTEWVKYPVDYIYAVMGLYEDRKENVLTWNTSDKDTIDMVNNEYICNIIKALELSFSPKFCFSRKERKIWIIKQIVNSQITSVNIPIRLGKYQQIVLKIARSENYNLLYFVLWVKVIFMRYFKRQR